MSRKGTSMSASLVTRALNTPTPPDTKRIRELETGNRGIGKSDCVTGRITSTRPVHNHLLPTPRLTVSYLTIQYQTTFLWMGFCEI